jgi:hypothetical protein
VEKAELFQHTFSSCYVQDNGIIPPLNVVSTSIPANPAVGLENILFSASLVAKAIKKMKLKAKGGPDGIPPVFLKKCSTHLCEPLTYIFKLSFESGFLPVDWRRAYIAPIYKKSERTDPSNYRPIALTSSVCKLMETIIKDQLLSYLISNSIITKCQHAFLARHSTATNLLETVNDWSVELNSSNCIDSIYIDFSRAFDSISFSKLLFKLEFYGIKGRLLAWISCFLLNRSQCVVIENTFSSVSDVLSGVPQGSVLGPILFLIFINDIVSCNVNNYCVFKMFADDLKLYTVVSTNLSSNRLQNVLNEIFTWSQAWQLSINISKCAILRVDNSRHPNTMAHRYSINGQYLNTPKTVSDLGVTVDPKLSFIDHINDISSRATQRVGILFRGFFSRNLKLMRFAFVSYIRPLLEYNSSVWNPTQKYLINLLEKVQRSFTKRIPSISHLSYTDRLSALNLELLELRRLRFDLIGYYKIINNLTDISPSDFFTFYVPPASSRTPMPTLQKPRRANQKLLSSFCCRAIDAWNALPPSVKTQDSLPKFKRALLDVNLSKFLLGDFL